MPLKSSKYYLILLIVITLLVVLTNNKRSWENPPELFGTRDMIAFWAGTQLFLKGINPYISSNVLKLQKEQMPQMEEAQVFLNPPWALPIMSVFFSFRFNWARIIWITANIVFLLLSTFLTLKLYPGTKPVPARNLIALSCLHLPSLMVLWMGQISLFVLVCLLLALLAYRKNRPIMAGMAILPVLLKPHLVYLLGLWLLLDICLKRQWLMLLTGIISFSVICWTAELLLPGIFSAWQAADFSPLIFRSSTLVTRIRSLTGWYYGEVASWPIYAVPIIASLITIGVLVYKRLKISFKHIFPTLLAASLFFAPYAWFYDYSLLLPLHTLGSAWALSLPDRNKKKKLLALLFAPQILVLFQGCFTNDLGAYWWFPLAVVISFFMLFKIIAANDSKLTGSL